MKHFGLRWSKGRGVVGVGSLEDFTFSTAVSFDAHDICSALGTGRIPDDSRFYCDATTVGRCNLSMKLAVSPNGMLLPSRLGFKRRKLRANPNSVCGGFRY